MKVQTRRVVFALLLTAAMLAGCACSASGASAGSEQGSSQPSSSELSASAGENSAAKVSNEAGQAVDADGNSAAVQETLTLSVDGQEFVLDLADTRAARALAEKAAEGPVTVSTHSYGGFEQVGELPWSLPADDAETGTVPGDVMLYQGSQITIFYGSNAWSYTPLGKIREASADSLKDALGGSSATVTISASEG